MTKRIDIRKEFAEDWLTREAGERLREMILAATKGSKRVELDFGKAIIASTSFFDEGIAKLADHGWTWRLLDKKIAFLNMHPRDRETMKTLFLKREKQGDL